MTRREGYAFPLTLGAIAIIALIATIASAQVRASTEAMAALTDLTRERLEAHSAEQSFLYYMLTEPSVPLGLEIGALSRFERQFRNFQPAETTYLVRADGSANQIGDTPMVVRYFDEQAFFNLATTDEVTVRQLHEAFGTPSLAHDRLAAALADFQDVDDERRFSGAEAFEYDDPLLPANRELRHPLEACQVLGWAQTPVCDDPGLLLLLGAIRETSELNASMVSAPMLDLLMRDRRAADREFAFERAASGELTRFGEIGLDRYDELFDPVSFPTPPRLRFAVIVHDLEGQTAWRTDYLLTMSSQRAPFSVRGRYRIGGETVQRHLQIGPDDPLQRIPEPSDQPDQG
ncbi:MAG: hypothetical protein AAFX09_10465 [Pseudomonadota bacterium]